MIIFTFQSLLVKRNYLLPLFLLIQILLLKILSFFPDFVEHYYSQLLYVSIAQFLRTCLGWIPFSVGDFLYLFLIGYALYWVLKKRSVSIKDKIISALGFLSVVYFLFHFLWAFNYYRIPLAENNAKNQEYTEQDLVHFTRKLIRKTNEIHLQITHHVSQKVILHDSQELLFKKALNGYQKLAQVHPNFAYTIPSQKKSLLSLPLTYMGFAGYLNPFTNETQVNSKLPRYSFPNVVCHEMAHQIGYGSESECNFIGFLACMNNNDNYFKYATLCHALRSCLATISLTNEVEFQKLLVQINPGIIQNFKESEAFWQQYDTFIDKGFHVFYDQYLKSNQQEDGIKSYNNYLALLIKYQHINDLLK